MKDTPEAGETFRNHALVAAVVAVVGLGLAAVLPKTPEHREPALWGVGLAVVTGALSLGLKRRALKRSLPAALKVVGLVFALRAVVVVAGVYALVSREMEWVGFVAGFFGVYFVLMGVEFSYVIAAAKASAGGDK